ncbi:hypothetical protein EJD96_15805 [Herbaspirillum seropedicae]|jgi:hypothetical protein|uniref:hypothetical protein n=1 Tax=Herbaspirillum seropedicae TaxID=964 RepID=UPI000847EAC4|nr:hypothetical protein [Herbaspirillum seropedicae]AON55444.1 hypothetical protein Hsc_3175 [Herbaspirillum seropedicae]MDR6397269.1 hypothetical protein [Herbaspirillum seropedicae]QDD65519.1 hypothetical protein EJD96_15805 [Herbaspirillum seropedicae]
MINIITKNHGGAVHVQEHFEYIRCGLNYVGENVKYSHGIDGDPLWLEDGVNVVLECFEEGEMIVELIKLKLRFPKSKLIVVVTEMLKDGIFNSAMAPAQAEGHYSDLSYWQIRSYNFYQLIPYIDGLVLYAEALIPGYKEFGKPIFYLPLAAPPGQPLRQHFPLKDKNIDAVFSGSITPTRAELIERLRTRNYKVVALPSKTPEYIRDSYYARSKLVLGPKLGPETTLLSKWRAYYVLVNRHTHIFEQVSEQTDLDEYVYFANPRRTFVDECIDLIEHPDSFPLSRFNHFKESPELNYVDIFLKLKQFLTTSKATWFTT